jgi:hypothetical protein
MNMMMAPQIIIDLISIRNRRKLRENGNLQIAPKQDAVLVEDARRNVMKPNQNVTTAYAATLSAQAMPTRYHGQRTEHLRLRQHCKRKSACLPLRYLLITPGVVFAIRCTFRIANRLRSHIRSPAFLMGATVFEVGLSVWTNRSASHRKIQLTNRLKLLLIHIYQNTK